MQYEELEINNKMTAWANKDKQTSSAYNIEGEENTSSKSKNKEKARDGYVSTYECGKIFFTSTFERACTAQETPIRNIKEMLVSLNNETKELCVTNQDLRTYIDSCHKGSERRSEYL